MGPLDDQKCAPSLRQWPSPTGCGGGNGRPADTATGGGTRGKAVDTGSTLNPGSRPDTGGQGSLRLLHGCEVGFRGLPMWWDPKTLPPPALGAGPHLPAPVYTVTILPSLLPGASRPTAGWGAASVPESPGVNTARAKEPPHLLFPRDIGGNKAWMSRAFRVRKEPCGQAPGPGLSGSDRATWAEWRGPVGEDTAARAAPQFQTLASRDAVCLGGAHSTQRGLSQFPTECAPGIPRAEPSLLRGERLGH